MSTARGKDSDKKSEHKEYKEPDKKFKHVTSSVVTGANYALSASGAAGLLLTAVGFFAAIPALVLLLVPAGLGLIFCGVGIYNQAREPDHEDEMEHKLDEIKDELGQVMENQHQHHSHHHRRRSDAHHPRREIEVKGREVEVKEYKRRTMSSAETESKGCCASRFSIFSRKTRQVAVIEQRAEVIPLGPQRMVMDEEDSPVRLHHRHQRGG